tara:strand:+ start:378 stop:551 length:174 start_codon:yes stop_codon:yes gene_type:complete
MRHCYRCNKSGVPISNALCDDCKEEIVKDLTTSEYALPLIIVGAMSLLAVNLHHILP